jgi:hypothetical protein
MQITNCYLHHSSTILEIPLLLYMSHKDGQIICMTANYSVVPQNPIPWNLQVKGHTMSPCQGLATKPPMMAPLMGPSVAVTTSDPHSCTTSVTLLLSPAPTVSHQ